DRLMGVEQPYESLDQLQWDLIDIQGQPTEVTVSLRTGHLALMVAFLYPLLLMMLGVRYIYLREATKLLHERLVYSTNALQVLPANDPSRPRIEENQRQDRERLLALRRTIEWDWLARVFMAEDDWRTDPTQAPVPLANFGAAGLEKA